MHRGFCALHRPGTPEGRFDLDQTSRGSAVKNRRSLARAKRCRTTGRTIMRLLNPLRIAILAATASLLSGGAQAGPMSTNVAAMKSMVDQSTTEVRWGGVGFRGGGVGYRGAGFRGGGWGYRGGLGYRGYRGLGYGLAAGAIASSAYYGGFRGLGRLF